MGLEIEDLTVKLFPSENHSKNNTGGGSRSAGINVVDSVSISVNEGETVSIVGESGSGKSFLGLSILGLNPPEVSRIVSGKINLRCPAAENENGGTLDLLKLKGDDAARFRGRLVSMIFQDPNASLNPVMRIGSQITEAILAHKNVSKQEAKRMAISYLDSMNIDGKSRFNSYPYEMSGGMRQRVMIAMAMVLNPCLLIADEPTTALDVTTSLQVLGLIEKIKEDYGVGIMFITHDLTIARSISDRTFVFYAGQVMESGIASELIDNPVHPYTSALIKSIPSFSRDYKPGSRLPAIQGFLTKDDFIPGKCRFYSRCSIKDENCLTDVPLKTWKSERGGFRQARCLKV